VATSAIEAVSKFPALAYTSIAANVGSTRGRSARIRLTAQTRLQSTELGDHGCSVYPDDR